MKEESSRPVPPQSGVHQSIVEEYGDGEKVESENKEPYNCERARAWGYKAPTNVG